MEEVKKVVYPVTTEDYEEDVVFVELTDSDSSDFGFDSDSDSDEWTCWVIGDWDK